MTIEALHPEVRGFLVAGGAVHGDGLRPVGLVVVVAALVAVHAVQISVHRSEEGAAVHVEDASVLAGQLRVVVTIEAVGVLLRHRRQGDQQERDTETYKNM